MSIIREYMPNGMSLLVQSEYWKAPDGSVELDPVSVRIYPINDLGEVLEALPIPASDPAIAAAACRLRHLANASK